MATDEETQRAIWHRPTEYNTLRHGPPYLPGLPYDPVKMSSEDRAAIRAQVKQASSKVRVASVTTLSALLGVLQAVSLLHQTHHWSTSGPAYYADHLLFERLYNESQDFIDQVAERAVGTGTERIVASEQAAIMGRVLSTMAPDEIPDAMVASSLGAEVFVLQVIAQTISSLESRGSLTPGISNLLEGLADKHETFVYLLKQRNVTGGYSYDRL